MWEAFHGRATAYGRALDAGDSTALRAALARNVWRGAEAGQGPALLGRHAMAQDAHLAGQSLMAGRVAFCPPRRRGHDRRSVRPRVVPPAGGGPRRTRRAGGRGARQPGGMCRAGGADGDIRR